MTRGREEGPPSCKRRKFYKRKRNTEDQPSAPAGCEQFEEDIEAEFLPMNNIKSIVRMCLPEKDPATGKKYQVSKSFYLLLSDIIAEFLHLVCCKLYISLHIDAQPATVVISDEDILSAMESLGITQYSVLLRLFMSDYREMAYNVMMKRLGLQQSDAGLLAIAPSNEEEKVKNDENERITQLRE
jgi:hypothetical protein